MKFLTRFVFSALSMCFLAAAAHAQGVTTGSLVGKVVDVQQKAVSGASVIAIHLPSGTSYETTTRADGKFSIPAVRVGGPYSVTVAFSGTGAAAFQPETQENIEVALGNATDLEFSVKNISVTETITVTAKSDTVFNSERTGSATAISRETIAALPTISNRLDAIVRLAPEARGYSVGGADSRMNNITVDGSYFNNSFGLGNAPGERTNVAPISMEAVEQVQVSIAPYDVRQANFVGAGINTVTRSGANKFAGSGFYQFRNNDMVGKEAKDSAVNPGVFDFKNGGGWASGPVVKNRVFFFGSMEGEKLKAPGTTFRANSGSDAVGGSTTRVLKSDLDALSNYLKSSFSYTTGAYQDYDFATPGRRVLAKFDYNLNNRNKVSFRYNQLDSDTDVLMSNSASLGFGNRRTSTFGLNYEASNYTILENIKSSIGELNTVIGTRMANNLIGGYSQSDESRGDVGKLFPMVDILQAGSVYTSFGSEPFTPNNELRYKTFQLQDSLTRFSEKHSITVGASFEKYRSENVFFPGKQSAYVYNSLADFYADANDYLANPNRTSSPVTLAIFQVRYNNIPGQEKPIQPLDVIYAGGYAQDEWTLADNVKVVAGVRMDVASFGDTGIKNAEADAMAFRDETGATVQYGSANLPTASPLWSPRVGFNWDVRKDRNTQVRGGTGVFTGKPPFVWISNQIGNTGVQTGFEDIRNSATRPFNPNPDKYKPTTVTGAPAASYNLAITDDAFRFPQVWRTNVGLDQRLPWGITGTGEFLINHDVNGAYYINANLPAAQSAFAGADKRPRWTTNRINSKVTDATVLKTKSTGKSWNASATAKKAFRAGFVQVAYNYGESKNAIDPGSIANGSWQQNQQSGDPNNPVIGFSQYSPGHRFFVNANWRWEYFNFGATAFSVFWEARTIGNSSYIYSGDLNGDASTSNDLLYIPRNTGEMNFTAITGTVPFTPQQQAAAWEAYIQQDAYLSKHRGEYAQRNAVFLPFVKRMDLSVSQDIFKDLGGSRQRFQIRADFLNFGNLLNHNWGVAQRLVSNSPLTNPGVDANGAATYRLRVINNQLMTTSLQQTADLADVYKVMVSFRYFFN
jgi:Carboxypeptidase regulatory-like domain